VGIVAGKRPDPVKEPVGTCRYREATGVGDVAVNAELFL